MLARRCWGKRRLGCGGIGRGIFEPDVPQVRLRERTHASQRLRHLSILRAASRCMSFGSRIRIAE